MRIGLRHGLALAGATATALAATLVLVSGARAAITAGPLVNPISGRCLDVAGTQVDISTCTGGTKQAWTSTSAGAPRGTAGGVTEGLGAARGGTRNGTRRVGHKCTGARRPTRGT